MSNGDHDSFRYRGAPSLATVVLALWFALVAANAYGQTYTILYNFQGGTAGENPSSTLTLDGGGNLYGTAGQYVTFELEHRGSGWLLNPLHIFNGPPDGSRPVGRVVFGPNGTLYGATTMGGNDGCTDGLGCGVIYNLQPPPTACFTSLCPWNEQVLYRFTDTPNDGAWPAGDLVFDDAGNIYGNTYQGGLDDVGTAYKLTPTANGWVEETLYNFTYAAGVSYPVSGFLRDSAGNLYGTASDGISYNGCTGSMCGAVYELSPSGSGWTLTILHQFSGIDGSIPNGGLIPDEAGNLYGATEQGGTRGNGTVYELEKSGSGWNFRVIYDFQGEGDEIGPTAALFRDAAGNLYGVTGTEGPYMSGNLFQLTPSGDNWIYTDSFTECSLKWFRSVAAVHVSGARRAATYPARSSVAPKASRDGLQDR